MNQRDLSFKRMIHNVLIKESIQDDVELTPEMFGKVLKKLKNKGGKKYEFIIKSGPSLLNALYKLYDTVWKTETKPESWRDTVIVPIDKSDKNYKADITKKRMIHTKPDIVEVFGHMHCY